MHGTNNTLSRDQDPRQLFNDTEQAERGPRQSFNDTEQVEKGRRWEKQREDHFVRKWETQREDHYENPDSYVNLGARPRMSNKIDVNQKEKYRIEMNKEMYKKHEELEYKEPRESYTKQQNFPEDNQGQFQDYEQEESTPNKPNYPDMESFCNTEKPDQNITNIKKTTDKEIFYHQWSDIDNHQETAVEDTTPIRNRVVFNTKYHKNLPPPRQDQQNRSFQSGNQDQHRFHDQPNRSFQPGNQDRPRFQVPPPNMERDMIIKEINKMGINHKSNTQQDLHDQETSRKAVEEMRKSFIAKEKANKEEIEAAYRKQIDNLIKEKAQQKEANVQNNATSLAKINLQENTIYNLEQEKEYYKNQLDKMIQENQKQRIELGHKTLEIRNYMTNAEKYNEKIKDLVNKIQKAADMEEYYKTEQDEYIMQITELKSAMSSQSHTEQVLLKDIKEARAEIARLMADAQHTSIQSQQEGSTASEESTTNKAEDTSLVWDNSAGNLLLGNQDEIFHSILSQDDPISTSKEEDNKNIYENTTQISNDNNTNELLENMTTASEANKARMQMMILRSKEDLKEPSRFKDFVKE